MLDEKWGLATGYGEAERAAHDGDREPPLNTEISPDNQALVDELARAREHLERRAEANEIIAEWRDELRRRVQRTNLKAELIGVTAEEEAALIGEVAEFSDFAAP